jgi:GLPGLI family protein
MKKIITICILLLSACIAAKGQYVAQGKIEYERKVNIHRQMEDMEHNEFFERIKAQVPKFTVAYFNMYFNSEKVIYKPGKETENPFKMFGGGPATDNVVLTDLTHKSVQATKQVYEQKFLVSDSMRIMRWKITDEIRTIANYKCRKAVGKICDTVYVVAFYTDDILVSGGPEMFSGLPGMILELAIPRLYTTWVATNVDIAAPKETDFAFTEKGKKVSQQELVKSLQNSLKDWGKFAQRNIWWSVL